MDDAFTKHALSLGDEGKAWLESIPTIIAKFEEKWSIKVSKPFPLSYNYVAPAVTDNGEEVVLKIGFPKDREFQTEIGALEVFNGEGAEKLLKSDRENAVMLIERVKPGEVLRSVENDEEATRILAGVMKKLWKPVSSTDSFITITDWTKSLFAIREKNNGTTGPLPEYLVDKAQKLFEALLNSQTEPMLLHGDLHHDNVLSSDRAGWLAIDPKGIVGEPCYETAAMLRNPYGVLLRKDNLKQVLTRRIEILSEELGFDKTRIRDWGVAQTVLSAVWDVEEGKSGKESMLVANILDGIEF